MKIVSISRELYPFVLKSFLGENRVSYFHETMGMNRKSEEKTGTYAFNDDDDFPPSVSSNRARVLIVHPSLATNQTGAIRYMSFEKKPSSQFSDFESRNERERESKSQELTSFSRGEKCHSCGKFSRV